MKRSYLMLTGAAIIATLACFETSRAATVPAVPMAETPALSPGTFQRMAFRDSAEADMLRRAYRILATGDHDYKGHRVHAMHDVEAAGKLLDMNLAGDLKDHATQPLSDEKLREAEGLLSQVLSSADVKEKSRIVKHLNEAINQINTALAVR